MPTYIEYLVWNDLQVMSEHEFGGGDHAMTRRIIERVPDRNPLNLRPFPETLDALGPASVFTVKRQDDIFTNGQNPPALPDAGRDGTFRYFAADALGHDKQGQAVPINPRDYSLPHFVAECVVQIETFLDRVVSPVLAIREQGDALRMNFRQASIWPDAEETIDLGHAYHALHSARATGAPYIAIIGMDKYAAVSDEDIVIDDKCDLLFAPSYLARTAPKRPGL